jgi:hypothetical protein
MSQLFNLKHEQYNPQFRFTKNKELLTTEHEHFLNDIEDLKESSKIVSISDILEETTIPNGYIQRLGFTTLAGYSYDAVLGIPTNRQVTDIPNLHTSAWLTTSRGHYEHMIRKFVFEGVPSIFVGAEGSYHDSMKPPRLNGITLTKSAAAVLRFSEEISSSLKYIIDPTKRLLYGESRGAMVGMGIIALAKAFDQDILFADLIAPCFPRKFEISDAINLSKHIIHEPVSVVQLAGKVGPGRLIHYPSTLDLHPTSFASQVAIGPALFSGEAGELAQLIDEEKIIHITCFNDDFASMPMQWLQIFKNYKDVRITLLDGTHLTIADPETLYYLVARNKSFRLEHDLNPNNLNGQRIFDQAHELV